MQNKKLFLAKLIARFLPVKSWRQRVIKRFEPPIGGAPSPTIESRHYGKIYMPYYPDSPFVGEKPELYNDSGEKLDLFFIRDRVGCHCPYIDSSRYFLWDRFNIGLETHFYTHAAILETMGRPSERYGYFIESEAIIPKEYALFKTHKGIEKEFNAIFTYSEKLLNDLPNAKFFPSCASIWYGQESGLEGPDPASITDDAYLLKDKNVSMVCSDKDWTPMQKIRHRIAYDAQKSGKVDMFGKFNGGAWLAYKSFALTNYRFQIVVENDVAAYYFTEKIMDCFASMTIPVYLGATKIDDFFNPNGIIKIDENVSIGTILAYCHEKEYEARLEAVKDNFNRSLKYTNVNDMLYEQYFQKRIRRPSNGKRVTQ